MTTVEEIESAIKDLSDDDFGRLRSWFEAFDAKRWDHRLENDVAAGKLDAFADLAFGELIAGRCEPL